MKKAIGFDMKKAIGFETTTNSQHKNKAIGKKNQSDNCGVGWPWVWMDPPV